MGSDLNYDVVYRGETLAMKYIRAGRAVFFQRPLSCGGGYWLVRTYRDCFVLEPEMPVPMSLRQGIEYLLAEKSSGVHGGVQGDGLKDEFKLT